MAEGRLQLGARAVRLGFGGAASEAVGFRLTWRESERLEQFPSPETPHASLLCCALLAPVGSLWP